MLALPLARRLVGYFHRASSERCQGRDASDNNSQVVLDHGPHYKLGAVDIIGEGVNREDTDNLNHGDEYAEREDAKYDDPLPARKSSLNEHRERRDHSSDRSAEPMHAPARKGEQWPT